MELASSQLNAAFPFGSLYKLTHPSQMRLLQQDNPNSNVQYTLQSYVKGVGWTRSADHQNEMMPWTPETDMECRQIVANWQQGARSNSNLHVIISLAFAQIVEDAVPVNTGSKSFSTSRSASHPEQHGQVSILSSTMQSLTQSQLPHEQTYFQRAYQPFATTAQLHQRQNVYDGWCTLTTSADNVTVLRPQIAAYSCPDCPDPHYNPEIMILTNCVPKFANPSRYLGFNHECSISSSRSLISECPRGMSGIFDVAAFSFGNSFDHPWLVQSTVKTGEWYPPSSVHLTSTAASVPWPPSSAPSSGSQDHNPSGGPQYVHADIQSYSPIW